MTCHFTSQTTEENELECIGGVLLKQNRNSHFAALVVAMRKQDMFG